MLLELYPPLETEFKGNGHILHDAYDADVHEILNGEYILTFKIPVGKEHNLIKRDLIVKAATPRGKDTFRILDYTKHNTYIQVDAPSTFFDLRYKSHKHIKVSKSNGEVAVEMLKASMLQGYKPFLIQCQSTRSYSFSTNDKRSEETLYPDTLETLQKIIKYYKLDLDRFRFNIHLSENMGKHTGAILYEYKNIEEFEEDYKGQVVTRAHGMAKFSRDKKVKDKDGQETTEQEEITVTATVDSPLINNYPIIFEKSYMNNDVRSEQALKTWLMYKFSKLHYDIPKKTYKIKTNIVDGTKINLADWVVVRFNTHGIDMEIQCVEYHFDPIANEYKEIVFGKTAERYEGNIKEQYTNLDERIAQAEKLANIAMASASGKNTNFYGTAEPANPRNNDTWFTPDQKMFIYSEAKGMWIPFEYNDTSDLVKHEIEKLKEMLVSTDKRMQEQSKQFEAERDRLNKIADDANAKMAEFDELSEKFNRISERIDENIDDLRGRTDGILQITGADGHLVYGNNRLLGETDRVLTPYEDKTVIKHNGDGFAVGKKYTLHFCVQVDKRPVQVWGSGGSYRVTQESIYKEGD